MAESQLTLDLHLVTCHKYCTDDDLRCDERCGFANMIILYFQDKASYAENFPWHIPMEVVERIKQKIRNGEIKGNFPLLGIDNSEEG